MCLTLRHDRIRSPHPQMGDEWQPNVIYAEGYKPRRAGFHTSSTELLHLAAALGVLIAAFTIFLKRGFYAQESYANLILIAAVAIGTGFILHELMHKFVAQHYGHWAEFRAQLLGLLIPVPLVLATGIIAAAPGAVVISGFVRRHENGIISAAGPGINLVIALGAYPFTIVPGTGDTLAFKMAITVMMANVILALFNMIPIGPLDGRKVLRWNKLAYFGIIAAGLAVGFLAFERAF